MLGTDVNRRHDESAAPGTFFTPLNENCIPRVLEGVFRLLLWFKLLEFFSRPGRLCFPGGCGRKTSHGRITLTPSPL
jgi:hypothetical protein